MKNARIDGDEVKRAMNAKLSDIRKKDGDNFKYDCLVEFMKSIAQEFDFEEPDEMDILDLFR